MRWLAFVVVLGVAEGAGAEKLNPALLAELEKTQEQIGAGRFAEAGEGLKRARGIAADDPLGNSAVSYFEATLSAYRGDFEGAAQILLAALPEVEKRPDEDGELMIHNTVMMLREAQGDIAAALVECDEMTRAGRRATWGKPQKREQMVLLKDLWHRAYLLRMLAETQKGPRKAATLRYAEAARRGYAAAAPMPEYQDSLAVLDGYFAALDGDRARALEAARRVRYEENHDLEDLYLAVVGFEAGGDRATAEKVRKIIRESKNVYIAAPIMREWLARDQAGGARFTPRHPRGRP
jgi:hypothetical protein